MSAIVRDIGNLRRPGILPDGIQRGQQCADLICRQATGHFRVARVGADHRLPVQFDAGRRRLQGVDPSIVPGDRSPDEPRLFQFIHDLDEVGTFDGQGIRQLALPQAGIVDDQGQCRKGRAAQAELGKDLIELGHHRNRGAPQAVRDRLARGLVRFFHQRNLGVRFSRKARSPSSASGARSG